MNMAIDMSKVARSLIDRFGQLALLRLPKASPDPERPWLIEKSTAGDVPVTVAIVDINEALRDGERVSHLGQVAYLAGGGIEPTTLHRLIVEGVEYRIERVAALAPSGPVIYRELEIDPSWITC